MSIYIKVGCGRILWPWSIGSDRESYKFYMIENEIRGPKVLGPFILLLIPFINPCFIFMGVSCDQVFIMADADLMIESCQGFKWLGEELANQIALEAAPC